MNLLKLTIKVVNPSDSRIQKVNQLWRSWRPHQYQERLLPINYPAFSNYAIVDSQEQGYLLNFMTSKNVLDHVEYLISKGFAGFDRSWSTKKLISRHKQVFKDSRTRGKITFTLGMQETMCTHYLESVLRFVLSVDWLSLHVVEMTTNDMTEIPLMVKLVHGNIQIGDESSVSSYVFHNLLTSDMPRCIETSQFACGKCHAKLIKYGIAPPVTLLPTDSEESRLDSSGNLLAHQRLMDSNGNVFILGIGTNRSSDGCRIGPYISTCRYVENIPIHKSINNYVMVLS